MGKKKVFYDTCGLLNEIDEIINHGAEKFYISSKTIQELETIKTDNRKDADVKYNARKCSRWLKNNIDKYEVIIVEKIHYTLLETMNLEINPDNLIIACAYMLNKETEIVFVTYDVLCGLVARQIFELDTEILNENDGATEYKGYKEVTVDTNMINYIFNEYESGNNFYELLENQYLLMHNTDLNKTYEYKYNNGMLKEIVLPPSKVVKGLNPKQRLALDLLLDKTIPIKIIAGNYGSGKTLLSVKMALYHLEKGNCDKIVLVRNPIGSGEAIGFLPGTKEEKIGDFYKPIEQNLEGGEFQLARMIQTGQLEMEVPFFMKGLSINNSFVVVDEAEDLDVKTFKLIGTRLGDNSCIAYVGDWKQAEGKYTYNNGLLQFINKAKGNSLVGVVVLDEDVRSAASKVFANLE